MQLVDLNHPNEEPLKLRYSYPTGVLVGEYAFEVPGYPGVQATLRVLRHGERFNEGKGSPYREGGILVKSRRAIHEVTLFKFENDPYADKLFGDLLCPHIDTLMREYDEKSEQHEEPSPENPMRIITRGREGLAREHPFTKALYSKAESVIASIIDQEKEADQRIRSRIEDEEVRRRLSLLARAATRYLTEKLKELDNVPGGEGIGEPSNAFAIVPAEAKVVVGETKTLSVLGRSDVCEADQPVTISVADGQGIDVLTPEVTLKQRPGRDGILSATFKVHGDAAGSASIVRATQNGNSAEALIVVVEEPQPTELPTEFKFEREHCTVVYGKAVSGHPKPAREGHFKSGHLR